ncbi:hypothetical protein AS156_09090 [Bradyrhizobium macuxiense]|uniref:Rad50/SbcC-type AAA domain-containing protein n=1 Tax=Bradyrhizobium macuxiense TaxID=1755647 RepID=A0A109JQI4_9BRAD|nr:hypothetical protein [Bradyrhizobium macuxiense]KWV53124.1 hypothetical protein AS156_09090 [Bradyrhizobium macuxiense]
MLQIRSIVLQGDGVQDATVGFVDRANILAGESDTGKSYLVHCLDYIFGADEMRKRIEEATPYSRLLVEFENSKSQFLTLERGLGGGNLFAHNGKIGEIVKADGGERIAPKRTGKSKAKDVTATLFEFAGIREAELRKNDRGEVNRLTIRTLLPMFLVDEVSIIDEESPVVGRIGFDATARKRAFAYMLSGKDDAGIIATEKKDIAAARLNAKLDVISELLIPIEERLQKHTIQDAGESIDKVDATIATLSQLLSDNSGERRALEDERLEALATVQRAESQLLAIEELLKQYGLLNDRYRTDLERLDFIAEGAHFFESLQQVKCPLCDQLMSPNHAHTAADGSDAVYRSARAEASKIRSHTKDLEGATKALAELRSQREAERNDARGTIKRVDTRIQSILAPAIQEGSVRLDQLVARRVQLETARSDELQASDLRGLRQKIESANSGQISAKKGWEPLPATSLRDFCAQIEAILKEWNWDGEGRVEFDEAEYDIKVDGQPRQSHGKGVRAILHSAFVIGLLRYCQSNEKPHPGTVILDSPLTSYKKGESGGSSDGPISAGIEAAFWKSLRNTKTGAQIIIIENKEPPSDVAKVVHYEWFAGQNARAGERKGFIPVQGQR